jgi:hypothetical protein
MRKRNREGANPKLLRREMGTKNLRRDRRRAGATVLLLNGSRRRGFRSTAFDIYAIPGTTIVK